MSTENTFKTLITKMENIVKRYVKAYREDFKQDILILQKYADPNVSNECKKFVWIVRECGTNLVFCKDVHNSTVYDYYLREETNRFYEIDLVAKTCSNIRNPVKYLNDCKCKHKELTEKELQNMNYF